MKTKVTYDGKGTHLEWQHEGVTPKMIDWFWSNMEKAMLLWHPEQHEPLEWAVSPKHGNPIGSIHIAPQTWNDGTRQNLYIRFEDLNDIPDWVKEYVVYEHCVIVAAIGLGEESLKNPEVMGYRIHQWQKTDYGVEGKSSAIGIKKLESEEDGLIWATHCEEEIGNWGVFLPQLYNLYRVVKNTEYNPYADLSLEGKGKDLKYKYIK
ncbi:hypothetical protein [Wukongibacter sp. M2B1]|uniref:hypothetical protein n=1 Tax=Wukongibacter sp. M2B1 TaxID=3088895 RepID=UPI003D798359